MNSFCFSIIGNTLSQPTSTKQAQRQSTKLGKSPAFLSPFSTHSIKVSPPAANSTSGHVGWKTGSQKLGEGRFKRSVKANMWLRKAPLLYTKPKTTLLFISGPVPIIYKALCVTEGEGRLMERVNPFLCLPLTLRSRSLDLVHASKH